jgi:hypothetical protein
MSGLVKLACPRCGCVVFEPEAYLNEMHECLGCGHAATIGSWKATGANSEHHPDGWITLAAIASRSRRLLTEIKGRAEAIIHSYGGGFST